MEQIITIKCGHVNCYLITNDKSAILIDTATKNYSDNLLSKIKGYNVKLIVLTHGHIDHIANTAFLAHKLNAKIAMHRLDYKLSKNNSSKQLTSNSLMGSILKKISEWDFKKTNIPHFEPDFFIDDNQSLIEYGINAKILSLPGHTAGSIGILLLNNKVLIVGDLLMNMLKPTPALIAEDFAMLHKSINQIKLLGTEIIYVGHGNPITAKKLVNI